MKKNKSLKNLIWRIFGFALVLVQTIVSIMCVVALCRMRIFEAWVVVLATMILVLLVGGCVVPVFVKKKPIITTRVVCMVVSLMCTICGVFALRYMQAFNDFLDKVSMVSDESSEVVETNIDITAEPFIVYLSGSDSRTNVDDPTARSDVNILMVVNPLRHKLLLVSIPRDTYVQLHGTTGLRDKLTHAGLNNNIELSKATLEDFLGIEISYTVKVSFDTVIKVVDELDGIDIYSDTEMLLGAESKTDGKKKCYFYVGTQHVDGDCALRFARERKTYGRGDRHRGENQQEVLTAIINKFVSSKDYLLRLPEILEIAADSFKTSFTRDDITTFLRFQLANGSSWQIKSIGLDGVGDMLPTYTYGEDMPLWVMLPDEESYAQIIATIDEYLAVDGE